MNPYKVLEIGEQASKDEIRKAYRKLARKYHPDSNPGNKEAEEKFKTINDAYTILSDEKKKAEYDANKNNTGFGDFQNGRRAKNNTSRQGFDKGSFAEQMFRSKVFDDGEPVKRTSSNMAKGDFRTDKESIYNQFSDFFGFRM